MIRRREEKGVDSDDKLKDGEATEKDEDDEEFPANVECHEYDEEDVYIMVDLPPAIDGEALLSASAVTVKVCAVI